MKPLRIGFTGTRAALTQAQVERLRRLLRALRDDADVFVHGGCVGADETAAGIADYLGYGMVCRPALGIPTRLRSVAKYTGEVYPAKPPLARNRDIVDDCDLLVACPIQEREVVRSGTWATVRYARKVGRPIYLIWPDGGLVVSEGRVDADGDAA